jgi:putative ABC transport system ATP-binding protein
MGNETVVALDHVTLTVDRGELVSLVGPSGSGKTTLLDIIGCLSMPTSGDYTLNGKSVTSLSEEERARTRNQLIGFIFQTFHLLPRHTALMNVALPLFYSGINRDDRIERSKEALQQVGLGDRLHHLPRELSGGQQQRVVIARALVNQSEIILADEPTGNLDSKSGKEVIDLLLQLHQKGHTVIIVTHDAEIANCTHRRIALKDGQIVSDSKAIPTLH